MVKGVRKLCNTWQKWRSSFL